MDKTVDSWITTWVPAGNMGDALALVLTANSAYKSAAGVKVERECSWEAFEYDMERFKNE
jgi:hypothetical protein